MFLHVFLQYRTWLVALQILYCRIFSNIWSSPVERPETVKMLVTVTLDVRQWIERVAAADDRTLSSVVNRALRSQMAEREKREEAVR